MSRQITTYTAGGTDTYTAPATLLNGSVTVAVYGAPGGTAYGTGGHGGVVSGTVTVAAGGTLTAYVGDLSGHGYHPGGTGETGGGLFVPGAHGGGSSAVLAGGTVLLEAGGGGGGGGSAADAPGGNGGKGGLAPAAGSNGSYFNTGLGGSRGGGGGGGGGSTGNGGNGPGTTQGFDDAVGLGGTAPSGAGGDVAPSGFAGSGLFNAGGGGGAGGKSFAALSVAGPVFTDGGATAATVVIAATVADPPLAPTLLGPGNGSYLDSAAVGVTFTWVYHPGVDSGTVTGYALRVSTDGGAYQFWNATSGLLQGSIVWNPSSSSTAAIPAGTLADGHSYTWSAATQESHYSLQGGFAADAQFTGTAMPTVTVTAPAGTVSVPTPTVVWSETLGGGDTQTSFRAVVYTQTVTASPGFSPGVTVPTVDSGVVSSTATAWTLPTPLNQGAWAVYVQVVETGAVASAWTSSLFTVAFDPPAAPTVTVAPTFAATGVPTVTVTVAGADNLAGYNTSSFENTVGTWTATANCSLALSSAQAEDGAQSLAVTATAGGAVTLSTATGLAGIPVTGSLTYTALVSFRAATTVRTVSVGIGWYNAAGTLLSTSTGSTVTDSSSGWTQATVTAAAPSTAVYAALVAMIAGAAGSEVHYLDQAALYQAGTAPAWTRGGLVGSQLASVSRSVDGGATWTPVRGAVLAGMAANTQQFTVVDYETPFGVVCTYQATVSANVTAPVAGIIASSPASATVTVVSEQWWLTDPVDTTVALALHRLGSVGVLTAVRSPMSFQSTHSEQMGVFYAFGRTNPIIQRGTKKSPVFALSCLLDGYAEKAAFDALVGNDSAGREHTLLIRSDMSDAWYVVIGPDIPVGVLRAADRTVRPQHVVSAAACTVTDIP